MVPFFVHGILVGQLPAHLVLHVDSLSSFSQEVDMQVRFLEHALSEPTRFLLRQLILVAHGKWFFTKKQVEIS